jgi:peptide-methionine (R)-S-oxide reductase
VADGAQYKDRLTDEQYDVLFNKATEAPFSGEYDQLFAKGTYACAACGTVLFGSDTKFDAHCGWPSFYDAKPDTVLFVDDTTMGMKRTEVICATCGGHLGHVFEGEGLDVPTDQRYCINSLSLTFIPEKEGAINE